MLNMVITNCASLRGMPKAYHVLKPVWCLFFVGSHKCAYPTDIEVISDRVKSLSLQYFQTSLPRGELIYFSNLDDYLRAR